MDPDEEKLLVFSFGANGQVTLEPPTIAYQVLIQHSEFIKMLSVRTQNSQHININMEMFDVYIFQCIVACLNDHSKIALEHFHSAVDIICYIILHESVLGDILPQIPYGK